MEGPVVSVTFVFHFKTWLLLRCLTLEAKVKTTNKKNPKEPSKTNKKITPSTSNAKVIIAQLRPSFKGQIFEHLLCVLS